jgi:hypothetical protein
MGSKSCSRKRGVAFHGDPSPQGQDQVVGRGLEVVAEKGDPSEVGIATCLKGRL